MKRVRRVLQRDPSDVIGEQCKEDDSESDVEMNEPAPKPQLEKLTPNTVTKQAVKIIAQNPIIGAQSVISDTPPMDKSMMSGLNRMSSSRGNDFENNFFFCP